ncbi:hypothetical protein LCGC14_1407120 [marine sediment metagenome]|uniref:Uncharacterized protein n=1 Tax=marine sediment metagenome TaxID=412755 RepID=A0A0F9MX09_9ZZZZ
MEEIWQVILDVGLLEGWWMTIPHFLLSGSVGLLVYWWTSTTLSRLSFGDIGSHKLLRGDSGIHRFSFLLALSFAFRDVLTSLHVPVNICILDEVLDAALDTVGVRAASRLLKRKARDEKLSLYIISHRDDLNFGCDKTMTVQMSKGFSYIKEE